MHLRSKGQLERKEKLLGTFPPPPPTRSGWGHSHPVLASDLHTIQAHSRVDQAPPYKSSSSSSRSEGC